eukprot:7482115-Heterocapsa_arctica.AAC.1
MLGGPIVGMEVEQLDLVIFPTADVVTSKLKIFQLRQEGGGAAAAAEAHAQHHLGACAFGGDGVYALLGEAGGRALR